MSGDWLPATVIDADWPIPTGRSLWVRVDGWPGNLAGQHVDVRLTAEDGYRAERSYSISTHGPSPVLEFAVDELPDGEVSPYLVHDIEVGDRFEVRGPVGRYFVWEPAQTGPVQLIAGGSGIVPLMAMLRHHAHADPAVRARIPVRLLYSARSWDDVLYRDELATLAERPEVEVIYTLTRDAPEGWSGARRRIDRAMLESAAWP
ncbi:MAG: FAD-binding oxidoreductase, partial [Microbacteriaceae bacterium]